MTRDEIIRMAMQVGCTAHEASAWEITLTSFATLVAAAEREACAQVAEEWLGPVRDRELHIAAAIRARSQQCR